MEHDDVVDELDDQELEESLDKAMVELSQDIEAFNKIQASASFDSESLDWDELSLIGIHVTMSALLLQDRRKEAVARGLKVAEWCNRARAEAIMEWSKAIATDWRKRRDCEFLASMGITGGLAPEGSPMPSSSEEKAATAVDKQSNTQKLQGEKKTAMPRYFQSPAAALTQERIAYPEKSLMVDDLMDDEAQRCLAYASHRTKVSLKEIISHIAKEWGDVSPYSRCIAPRLFSASPQLPNGASRRSKATPRRDGSVADNALSERLPDQ